MFLRLLSILVLVTVSPWSAVHAYEWIDGSIQLYEADINGDGYTDLLIMAPRELKDVVIPYDLSMSISVKVGGQQDVILYGQPDGSYIMDFNPVASLVGDEVWNERGWMPSLISPTTSSDY